MGLTMAHLTSKKEGHIDNACLIGPNVPIAPPKKGEWEPKKNKKKKARGFRMLIIHIYPTISFSLNKTKYETMWPMLKIEC